MVEFCFKCAVGALLSDWKRDSWHAFVCESVFWEVALVMIANHESSIYNTFGPHTVHIAR